MRKFLKVWTESPVFRELATGAIALASALIDCIIVIIALCFQCYPVVTIACIALIVHLCCAGWLSPD